MFKLFSVSCDRAKLVKNSWKFRSEVAKLLCIILNVPKNKTSSAEDGENMETGDKVGEGAAGYITVHTTTKREGDKLSLLQNSQLLWIAKSVRPEAVCVVAETAKSLGQNIGELALYRHSIRQNRVDYRGQRTANIKLRFWVTSPCCSLGWQTDSGSNWKIEGWSYASIGVRESSFSATHSC